jgi:hypothetical protein
MSERCKEKAGQECDVSVGQCNVSEFFHDSVYLEKIGEPCPKFHLPSFRAEGASYSTDYHLN